MLENSKTLNVRLGLKYDTYENWSTNNPVLLAGEVAFTTVPQEDTNGISKSLPAVVAKVGDGTSNYNDLPFLMAKAADVSEWAKADVKPEYTATEIAELDTFISELVTGELGISIDTDTQYTVVKVNDYQYKLMAKAKGDETFTIEVATLDIPKYDDTALTNRVNGIDERLTTAEGEIDTLQNQIGGLTGAMHFKGVVDVDPTTITEGYASGDVVLFNKKEYVFDETQSKFIELGDEGSLVTRDELTAKADELKSYTDTKIDALTTDDFKQGTKTLVLNCGDSFIDATNTDEGTEA